MHETVCRRVEIQGIVQGVGFRPFVYRLARRLGLKGIVRNHNQGVRIEIEGALAQLDYFIQALNEGAPLAAQIESIKFSEVAPIGFHSFEIGASFGESFKQGLSTSVRISPDLALCLDCRRDIWDPDDRRYFYPFTNCTNCGPRLTIIKSVPYDRAATTMDHFPMCAHCLREYGDPANRRFHAEPNACPACGPRLSLVGPDQKQQSRIGTANPSKSVLEGCSVLLGEGNILAIKSIGGFHLACDALNENAVRTLRSRKLRESKPFAVLFSDVEMVRQYVHLSVQEEQVLRSSGGPIVLCRKLPHQQTAPSVAPGNSRLGVMLPYTPLHDLLIGLFGRPLVLTSGNQSDEPIAYENSEALMRLRGIADYFLIHDRDIHIRCDDSVVSVTQERPSMIRRSRGFAPKPMTCSEVFAAPILGVGAELKNTFCLAHGTQAILSHHIGDLKNIEALESFEQGVAHFKKLFDMEPEFVAHDLHPDYLSTRWAKGRLIGVQHHHAHIAACLEENHQADPVIGLALDGTGFGPDGTIWGGELFLADRRDFLRVGHLRPVSLAGGNQAIRYPWRGALGYLLQSGFSLSQFQDAAFLAQVRPEHVYAVDQAYQKNLNCFTTSSCGRLFDAVSSLAGIVPVSPDEPCYEGEAAIALEYELAPASPQGDGYAFGVENANVVQIDWRPVFRDIMADLRAGISKSVISQKFHDGLVRALVTSVEIISKKYRIRTVALSGGCFLNDYLRVQLLEGLGRADFKVLIHRDIPTNDGGISFGQVVVANQIIKNRSSGIWKYK